MPSSDRASSASSSARASPAITTDDGPLTAATSTRSTHGANRATAWSGANATDAMPPRPDNRAAMAWLRNATTRAASSRDRAPATHAAAISPCECPTTASGRTPTDDHTAARPTITAKQAGCSTSTRSRKPGSTSPRRTSTRDQSSQGSSAAAHSATRSAKTGEESSSSRPMPAHCVPWPGNTHTSLPGASPPPVTRPGTRSPRASASRAFTASAREPGTTTARSSSTARPDTRAPATAAGEASATTVASRPACAASDVALRADKTSGTTPSGAASAAMVAGSSGASSRITCAFVPLTPNEDTPARRGRSPRGQSRACVSSSTAPGSQSTSVVGSATCSVAGRTPCRSACTILITPATPAAACACPMFDFNDPSHNGRVPVLPVGGQQRLRLDRVAQHGPGSVRLHGVHIGR